jgi:hypothetical protein
MWALSVSERAFLFRRRAMRIERVCSWCGKHVSWVEWEKPPDNALPITHTICPSCFAKLARGVEGIKAKTNNDEPKTNCHEKEIVK